MGDVLTGVNGQALRSVDDLADALDSAHSGIVSLQFQRGGRKNRIGR
jgi:S1-C subfamily serine protease